MKQGEFDRFCEQHMSKAGRPVPGRLQTALALLEVVRSSGSLAIGDYLVRGGASLKSHETAAKQAMARYALRAVNKNSGRRSSNLPAWGQPLLDALQKAGFAPKNHRPLEAIQGLFALKLRDILESDPVSVRLEDRTVESIISEVLSKADERGTAGAVGQYLVAAKLMLRYEGRLIDVRPYNQRDAKGTRADFRIAEASIEVALGTPDEKHLSQVHAILEESKAEVWLLVRAGRLNSWRDELSERIEPNLRQRVVVLPVESFVGQNISEIAVFSSEAKVKRMRDLLGLYNNIVDKFGQHSLRVVPR